jgi:heme exporter protein A
MGATGVLEAAGLDCERGGRVLFRALSLALAPGELLRIAGPNGRGKTSLLRILCGLLLPAEGEVRWKGEPITSLREDYSRQLVYVGHAPAVKDELTGAENLSIACRLAGVPVDPNKARGALDALSVPGNVLVKKLSQGQRRRVALARLVLSVDVPLWLLDEPFAALDIAAVALMEKLIGEHAARGGMVAFTTHQETRLSGVRTLDLESLPA